MNNCASFQPQKTLGVLQVHKHVYHHSTRWGIRSSRSSRSSLAIYSKLEGSLGYMISIQEKNGHVDGSKIRHMQQFSGLLSWNTENHISELVTFSRRIRIVITIRFYGYKKPKGPVIHHLCTFHWRREHVCLLWSGVAKETQRTSATSQLGFL